jgi:hypothetical protein
MSKLMRGTGSVLAVGVLLSSIFLVYCYTIGASTLDWLPYDFSELLINYSAGFVRRGLIGAIITWFSRGNSSLHIANMVLFCNYSMLAVSMTALAFLKPLYRGWIALLVLVVPTGIFHMALTKELFYCKEMFFFTMLAASGLGLSAVRSLPLGTIRKLASLTLAMLILLGGVVCSLIHEAFLFLALPAAMYLLVAVVRLAEGTEESDSKSGVLEYRAASVFVVLIVASFFVTAAFFHGGVHASDGIWANLNPIDRTLAFDSGGPHRGRGGIGSLEAGVKELWLLPLVLLQGGMTWWYLSPLVLLFLYSISLVALSDDSDVPNDHRLLPWLRCYGVLLLCSSPMFCLGWDWGRWINAVNISFLLVWLALRKEELFEPFSRLRLPALRGWLAEHRFEERLLPVVSRGERWIRQHASVVVCFLLLFALTFRVPQMYLNDSGNAFFGKFLYDLVRWALHKHASPIH